MRDIVSWLIYFLSSNTALENTLNIILAFCYMNSSRTINKIDSFSKCHILPNFSLPWNRCRFADLFLFQRVYHTGFTDIGISNKSDADILFIPVEDIELPKEVDESTLSKGIGDTGSISDSGVESTEIFHPFSDHPHWYEICFID